MAACIEVVIKILFKTHCYSFGGKSFVQTDRGPIGLRVTNALTKRRIANWAGKVKKFLNNNNIKVHPANSYVDDICFVINKIEKGIIYNKVSNSLVFSKVQYSNDIDKTDIEKTSEVMESIMNNVSSDLKFTTEDQSQFSDCYLPTLDFAMKLVHQDDSYKLTYKFFQKTNVK